MHERMRACMSLCIFVHIGCCATMHSILLLVCFAKEKKVPHAEYMSTMRQCSCNQICSCISMFESLYILRIFVYTYVHRYTYIFAHKYLCTRAFVCVDMGYLMNMCCGVQRTATHCNALQHTAKHCKIHTYGLSRECVLQCVTR